MNKLFVYLILTIILSLFSYSMEYEEVKLYFYSDKIDQNLVIQDLDQVNSSYFEGISHIRFFNNIRACRLNAGLYFWDTQSIRICSGGLSTIFEEVAHHRQKMAGDTLKQAKEHKGNFCNSLIEVASDYNIKNTWYYEERCK